MYPSKRIKLSSPQSRRVLHPPSFDISNRSPHSQSTTSPSDLAEISKQASDISAWALQIKEKADVFTSGSDDPEHINRLYDQIRSISRAIADFSTSPPLCLPCSVVPPLLQQPGQQPTSAYVFRVIFDKFQASHPIFGKPEHGKICAPLGATEGFGLSC
jgi:hypothetical protein